MYTYQCSKTECGGTWTLNEGRLNGFVLTCPVCGKGRGIFLSQTKNDMIKLKRNDGIEEMIISIISDSANASDELAERVSEFTKNQSITVISKDIEIKGKEISCRLQFKI